MAENIDYLYHARELQVVAIKNDTAESLKKEMLVLKANRSSEALSLLLHTPPVILQRVIQESAGSEKVFFNLVYSAALTTSKRDFVLGALDRLSKACSMDSRGLREVSIDYQQAHIISPDVDFALRKNPDILVDVMEESRFQATAVLLDAVQGSIPLMRYRRDAIKVITNLSLSFNGGEIGYLRTRVPSVNLKLWYPKDDRFPKLSFTVEDIAQPS